MRVLHIGKYYPPFPGGMETYLGDLLPALQELHVEVTALVHGHSFGRSDNPSVVEVPSYGQWLYAPLSPGFPRALNRLIKTQKPDILHLHMPNTSALWALALPSARRIPWLVHWHADVEVSSSLSMQLAYQYYRQFETRILARAKHIIATSKPYLSNSKTLKPWIDKCAVIPLGRAQSSYPQLNTKAMSIAKRHWNTDKKKILVVARMSYYKGLHNLIEAVRTTESITLIIAGPNTDTALSTLVGKYGLEDKIRLVGTLPNDQLHALIASCDCLCLPSIDRSEAFGLTLLEAMYYAKPVVASNIVGSGVTWVVEDGVTGILVEANNARQLAKAFETIDPNSTQWHTMGQEARKRFAKLFDLSHSSKDIVRLYKSML